jgi:hypothetical protein
MQKRTITFACATLMSLIGITVPADALYIHDMCNGTFDDGQGNSCPPGDYLLVRPKYTDGTCGDWMCCPKNVGGPESGYNCNQAVPPTRGAGIRGLTGTVLSGGTLTVNPKTGTTTLKQPLAPGSIKGGIMRRGVEGEQSGAPAPSEQSGQSSGTTK